MGGLRAATVAGGALLGVGVAVFLHYQRKSKQAQELLREYREAMLPPVSRLLQIKEDIVKEMEKGLLPDGNSNLLMLPTFVTQLPTGAEVGECYALDLGGTNFRVVYVKLSPEHGRVEAFEIHQVPIPKECYTGTREALFDFMAVAVQDFMERRAGGATSPRKNKTVPVVGFCFSFAMKQDALDHGELVGWTKGFDVDGVIGENVVTLLAEAFERAGCPCSIRVILNDTTGVLAAARYTDQDAEVSIIVGTGTNACYVEKVGNVKKWLPEGVDPETETIINIEWGSYDSPLLPYVAEDRVFDAISPTPGRYMFEKFVAGMCLGEVARLILLRFAREVQLFGPTVPPKLQEEGSFPTAAISQIEEDATMLLTETRDTVRKHLGIAVYSPAVLKTIQEVCQLVGQRSAVMVATGLAAVLEKAGFEDSPKRMAVAFDGGVYEKYAKFRQMLDDALTTIYGSRAAELKPLIKLEHCQDGSVLGGAVLAAAASDGSNHA